MLSCGLLHVTRLKQSLLTCFGGFLSSWGDDKYGSYVTRNSQALRRKRLADLTLDDVRLGIGQQIGLRYLVPLALDRLQADVFVEAQYYPGDLLKSILNVPLEFWPAHVEWRNQVETLAQRYFTGWESQAEASDIELKSVRKAYNHFTGVSSPRRWLRSKEEPPVTMP